MRAVDCDAMIMEGEMRSEAADEPWKYGWYSRRHVDRLFALAEEGLVDVVNMDLAIVGFTRWRRAMPESSPTGFGLNDRSAIIAISQNQLGKATGLVSSRVFLRCATSPTLDVDG
jgi:hypothetical protein